MAVVITFIVGIRAVTSEPIAASVFFAGAPERPLVIAHRGGAGERPGNTLLAFEHAVTVGADILELDVRQTADGQLVVFHDATVERTTNGQGPLAELTLAQLQALDAAYHWPFDGRAQPYRGLGVKVPSLEQVLGQFPQQRFSIEMKAKETPNPAAMAQPLCDLLQIYRAQERALVASFDRATMNQFRQACPEVATSAHQWEMVWFTAYYKLGLVGLYHPNAQVLQIPPERYGVQLAEAGYFAAAARRGMRTQVWTINDTSEMRRLYAAGVNGVITDFPEQAVAQLAARAKPP